jgi:hypothetical protein
LIVLRHTALEIAGDADVENAVGLAREDRGVPWLPAAIMALGNACGKLAWVPLCSGMTLVVRRSRSAPSTVIPFEGW